MANKKMFSCDFVRSEELLHLPVEAQVLYVQLCMHADDEGFMSIDTVRDVIKRTRMPEDMLNVLIDAGYVLRFPSGVCAIRHWFVNNSAEDGAFDEEGFTPTKFTHERSQLDVDASGMYVDRA